MKLSRRGLFGLGAGLGLAVIVGNVKPRAKAQPLKTYTPGGAITALPDRRWTGVNRTFTTSTAHASTIYVNWNFIVSRLVG